MSIDADEVLKKTVLEADLESDHDSHSRRVNFVARLTSLLGIVLLFLLAVEGVSVPLVSQLFTWHVVVGVILIPVMTAKIAVTSYRFALYYVKTPDFKRAGPPWMPLRIIGPFVVMSTVIMMASGVMLMVVGPYSSQRSLWFTLHRASFILWFGLMAIHVLSYSLRAANVSWRDLRRIRSLSPTVSTDSWYRVMIVIVTIAVGVGLATRFGTEIHLWIQAFQSPVLQHLHH
jgi:hypothetical protein